MKSKVLVIAIIVFLAIVCSIGTYITKSVFPLTPFAIIAMVFLWSLGNQKGMKELIIVLLAIVSFGGAYMTRSFLPLVPFVIAAIIFLSEPNSQKTL